MREFIRTINHLLRGKDRINISGRKGELAVRLAHFITKLIDERKRSMLSSIVTAINDIAVKRFIYFIIKYIN